MFFHRQSDSPDARSENVPEHARTDRTVLVPSRVFEENGGRRLLFGYQIADGAHLLDRIDRLVNLDDLAECLNPVQPVTEVLNRSCRLFTLPGCRRDFFNRGHRVHSFSTAYLPTKPSTVRH